MEKVHVEIIGEKKQGERGTSKLTIISNFGIVDTKQNVDVHLMINDDAISLRWLKDHFSICAIDFTESWAETFYWENIVDKKIEFLVDSNKFVQTESFLPYVHGEDKMLTTTREIFGPLIF